MSTDAMTIALNALEKINKVQEFPIAKSAIKELKFAIKLAQKPSTWHKKHKEPEKNEFIEVTAKWHRHYVEMPNPIEGGEQLMRFYFNKPQNNWVGLTSLDVWESNPPQNQGIFPLIQYYESKFIEKNTTN